MCDAGGGTRTPDNADYDSAALRTPRLFAVHGAAAPSGTAISPKTDANVKDLHYPELRARVAAVLRRQSGHRDGPRRVGDIVLDRARPRPPLRRQLLGRGDRGVQSGNSRDKPGLAWLRQIRDASMGIAVTGPSQARAPTMRCAAPPTHPLLACLSHRPAGPRVGRMGLHGPAKAPNPEAGRGEGHGVGVSVRLPGRTPSTVELLQRRLS